MAFGTLKKIKTCFISAAHLCLSLERPIAQKRTSTGWTDLPITLGITFICA